MSRPRRLLTLLASAIVVCALPGVAAAAVAPSPLGEQHTLIVPITFANAAGSTSPEAARTAVFSGLDAWLRRASHGRTWLSGDVVGVTVAPYGCDGLFSSSTQVDASLRAQGFDPDGYTRVAYWSPALAGCGGEGFAAVGGKRLWLNGPVGLNVLAHEFGHLLGLVHAHARACLGTPLVGSGCSEREYGDWWDVMGSARSGAAPVYNAYEQAQLGWLTSTVRATADGSYRLASLSAPDGGPAPRALIVPTPQGDLWIERRDAGDAPVARLGDGFVVHRAPQPGAADQGTDLATDPSALGTTFFGLYGELAPFRMPGLTITLVTSNAGSIALRITHHAALAPSAPALLAPTANARLLVWRAGHGAATYRILVDGRTIAVVAAPATRLRLPAPLSRGSHRVQVVAVSAEGLRSAPAARNVRVSRGSR